MLTNNWVEPKTHSGRTIVTYDPFAEKYETHYNYFEELKPLILEHIKIRNLKFKDFDHIVPLVNVEFFIDDNDEISYRLDIKSLKMMVENIFRNYKNRIETLIEYKKYGIFSYKRYILNRHIKKSKKTLENMDVSTIKLDANNEIDMSSFVLKYPELYVREIEKTRNKDKEKILFK
jgi:hypothetical protein